MMSSVARMAWLCVLSRDTGLNQRWGANTVYQQQLSYYEEQGTIAEVRVNYDEDLIKDVTGWMDKGDQVIVMLDANVDLATNEEGFKEKMEDIGTPKKRPYASRCRFPQNIKSYSIFFFSKNYYIYFFPPDKLLGCVK